MKIKIADHYFTAMTTSPKESLLLPEEEIIKRAGGSPDQIAKDMSETGVWNVIQDDSDVNTRLLLAVNLIQTPQLFLKNPAKEILTPEKNSTVPFIERRWKFRSTAEKEFVMSMMERYVQDIPGAKGIASTLLIVADELFTNALFNAPFGDLDSTLDRSTVVVLDPEMSAEIIIGHTPDRVFIGCLDSFGTLNCESLIDRIYRGFNDGIANSVNMEVGGAGIGILRIVDLSADIYVVVEKDKKTLVGCSFGLKRSPKKIRQTGKSFHFQSFQMIESPMSQICIERRDHRAVLRLMGNMTENFPFGEIDLTGINEVSLDLRKLKLNRPQDLQPENFSLLSGPSGEIHSLCLPLFCSSCKFSENFFFVKAADEESNAGPDPQCPKCHQKLEPDQSLQKLIQK